MSTTSVTRCTNEEASTTDTFIQQTIANSTELKEQKKNFQLELTLLEHEIKELISNYCGHKKRLDVIAQNHVHNRRVMENTICSYKCLGSEYNYINKRCKLVSRKVEHIKTKVNLTPNIKQVGKM